MQSVVVSGDVESSAAAQCNNNLLATTIYILFEYDYIHLENIISHAAALIKDYKIERLI